MPKSYKERSASVSQTKYKKSTECTCLESISRKQRTEVAQDRKAKRCFHLNSMQVSPLHPTVRCCQIQINISFLIAGDNRKVRVEKHLYRTSKYFLFLLNNLK